MSQLISAFAEVLTIQSLFFISLGVLAGSIVGAIPGLAGAMLIVIVLPFTVYMQASAALNLLVVIYVGAVSGGLISATLLRIPGTASSIVTTFDGCFSFTI